MLGVAILWVSSLAGGAGERGALWSPPGQRSCRKGATAGPRARERRGGLLQEGLRLAAGGFTVAWKVVVAASVFCAWLRGWKRKRESGIAPNQSRQHRGMENPPRALTQLPWWEKGAVGMPVLTLPLPGGHVSSSSPSRFSFAPQREITAGFWAFPVQGAKQALPHIVTLF